MGRQITCANIQLDGRIVMPVFRALVGDYGPDASITYYVHAINLPHYIP